HVDAQLVLDDGLLHDRVGRRRPPGGISDPAERGEHPEDHGRGCAGKGETRPGRAIDGALRADVVREALNEFLARLGAMVPKGRLWIKRAARPSMAPHSDSFPSAVSSQAKWLFI